MARQLVQHYNVISRIGLVLGNKNSASDHLSKCLYSVSIGSNDYINNYYMPDLFVTGKIYSPDQFADMLAKEMETNLKVVFRFISTQSKWKSNLAL